MESSNKTIFINLYKFFKFFFFIYIKMPKNFSAKDYQENKEIYQNLSKEEKEMKKGLLSIEKNRMRKITL